MDKTSTILLFKAYAMSIVTKARVDALIKYIIREGKEKEFEETVKNSIMTLIKKEENDDVRAILQEAFEGSE